MTTTFETASIRDRVWCVSLGWGIITQIVHDEGFPIIVKFESGYVKTYTETGREYSGATNQILFWDEIDMKAPTKPLPKLNKDDCVEVWDANTTNPSVTQKRHFSHFKDGLIFCFDFGGTSWTITGTTGWNRWRKPE